MAPSGCGHLCTLKKKKALHVLPYLCIFRALFISEDVLFWLLTRCFVCSDTALFMCVICPPLSGHPALSQTAHLIPSTFFQDAQVFDHIGSMSLEIFFLFKLLPEPGFFLRSIGLPGGGVLLEPFGSLRRWEFFFVEKMKCISLL